MKSFLKLSFLSMVICLFSSCGKKNEAGKMIPSDALFVAQVNFKSLQNKLSWEDIKKTNWYQKFYSDSSTPDWRRKILDNPSASGIDFDEGITFFSAKNAGADYIAAEGKLKSEKDFEQFNKSFDPSKTIQKEGKINLLMLKDNNVVGWNNDYFVYVMNPKTSSSDLLKYYDSTAMSNNQANEGDIDLVAVCKNLFSLKADSSLSKNDHFAALLKEKGDVNIWQNTEAIIKSSSAMGMLGMMKLDAFTKDNISTYTINFEKGKINVDQKVYASKELTDVVKKYMGNSINMEMIKNLPSKDVFALFAFNFKSEGITELIKLTGADGMINSYTQQLGFNLDDFSKASNGNWLLAFSDFNLNEDSMKMKPAGLNYIFSFGIGDKGSLQKIITAAEKTASQLGKDSVVNYVMNDKLFALSNEKTFATQYLNGNNTQFDFSGKISGHPVGFYFDMHKILTAFSNLKTNTGERKEMLNQSLNTWDNVIGSGGEFKDGGFTFHAEVNLVNKDTNSLKQLNKYFDEMYTIKEAKKDSNTAKLDSLLVPPPIDTVKVK